MNTLLIVFQMLPLALDAVRAVEQAIPLPGQGKRKLDLVLNILRTAYDGGAVDVAREFSWQKLVAIVVPMIAHIVGVHNELGLFQKSTPANI